jgi:chromosomal replication initiator protein
MQASAEKIWNDAQGLLRTMLNPDIYNLWFMPVRATELNGELITLEVANDFCEVWLKDNYLGLIRDVILHASGQPLNVRFQVASGTAPLQPPTSSPVLKPKPKVDVEHERSVALNRELVLNPKNTFETFVVGETNNHAHAAALAVAQAPGKSYNPLFLYGGVGLGKTHLLHAIGQYVTAHKKNARVAYVSSEKFTNEYIDAIQNSKLPRFANAIVRPMFC